MKAFNNNLIEILMIVVLAGPGRVTALDAPKPVHHLDAVESEILVSINAERTAFNKRLTPGYRPLVMLKRDTDLQRIARGHSDDMIRRSFFEHADPGGRSFQERIMWEHRRLITAGTGENIWKQEKLDPEDPDTLACRIVADWMGSTKHRLNILSNAYTHTGIGVSCEGLVITATQDFAGVITYIDPPLPVAVRRGQSLQLVNREIGRLGSLEKFDFWDIDKQRAARNPIRNKSGKIDVPTGNYQFRFYFSQADRRGWIIYPGPFVRVE
ncbi:hypothetical protein JXA40_02080 [bacterium]|nr:hypothetical protein [candidate division CSSED10-310 bacterium]